MTDGGVFENFHHITELFAITKRIEQNLLRESHFIVPTGWGKQGMGCLIED